jgi:hypothetical protein
MMHLDLMAGYLRQSEGTPKEFEHVELCDTQQSKTVLLERCGIVY